MKLPGTLDFGVQSLGRTDTAAMRAKTTAEQNAALAWGNALATAGNEVAAVATAEGLADANLTLSERVAMDKKSIAELDAYLDSNPSVNLTDENVPAAVRKAAAMAGYENGLVDTFEIAIESSKQHFETSRKASTVAIGEKNNAKQALTKYNQQMDTSWARSAQNATKVHVLQRLQHLSARADLSYNNALNDLDEVEMLKIAGEMEQTGVWTPEYAGAKVAAIGTTVDTLKATRRYSEATTQGELDATDDFVEQSRIDPESYIKMLKMSRQTAEFMFTQEMRKQPVNYGNAQAKLIEGKLTKAMVADMVRKQEISGAHANTLRNALNTPKLRTSNPVVMNDFTGKIAMLRFADPNMDPDSVKDRAEKLRKEFQQAFTGTGPTGEQLKSTLTGEDFSKLMQALDTEVNTALGAGGRVDSIAMTQIKQLTGYSDFISAKYGGAHPRARAKADFERALIDYKDANPTGDAMEFVARNTHLYIADKYEQEYAITLGDQLPEYADEILLVVSGKGKPIKVNVNKTQVELIYGTADSLLARARTDAINGDIQWSDFERLRRGLQYKYEDVDTGARESDG